ncbi:MAG: pyridoxamine 5'-phosphate oxidase family protein [Devosiaceae bacterium]|nr:pyridoxamine 5'-phosphate oxidase family protein [Devosiaceae bacterium MH13]
MSTGLDTVDRASEHAEKWAAVTSVEELELRYGTPSAASTVKVLDRITQAYAQLIAASPLCALATVGPEGIDCSPRGDAPHEGMHGTVRIENETTIMLPDRRGNNRIDSLRNIVRDPRVALLFFIPGSGTTLRLNGTAIVTMDEALTARFVVDGKAPRSVVVITVRELYFQCARAIARSGLWDPANHVDPASLPTPGALLAEASDGTVGGKPYDEAWPERAAKTMW